jgi:hypothetical protein
MRTLIAASLFLAVAATTAAQREGTTPTAATRTLRLSGAGQDGAALALSETGPEGMAIRLLLRTPAGRQVILTYRFAPREGRTSYRLVDDETDWWVSVEKLSGLKFNDFSEAINQDASIPKLMEKDHEQSIMLVASGVPRTEHVGRLFDEHFESTLLARMKAEGTASQLAAGLPAGAKDGLAFLQAIVRNEKNVDGPQMFREFTGLLVGAMEHGGTSLSPRYSETMWHTEMTFGFKGTRDLPAPQVELARTFRRIEDPRDPMKDAHLQAIDGR